MYDNNLENVTVFLIFMPELRSFFYPKRAKIAKKITFFGKNVTDFGRKAA